MKDFKIKSNQLLPLGIFMTSFLVFSLFSRAFLTFHNMMNILELTTFVAVPALGLATVMLTGYFDLSFVGVIGMAGVLNVTLVNMAIHPIIVLVLTLLTAILLELVNAVLIVKLRIHPWLCTIATMLAYLGLEKSISKSDYISPTTEFFNILRFGKIAGVPVVVWMVILVWLFLSYIMAETTLGTYLYATGGNRETAKKAGLNTDLYSFIAYGIMGVLCWVASIAYVAQLSGYPPEAAYTNQLEVILAVFFGMALSKKGIINVFGAFLGAAYVGFLANGLGLFGVSSYWIKLVEGVLVVLVILGNSVKHGTLVQLD